MENFEDFEYKGDVIVCTSCGGDNKWCATCQMYTHTCCDEDGTCACNND